MPKPKTKPQITPTSLPVEIIDVIARCFKDGIVTDIQCVPREEMDKGKAWFAIQARPGVQGKFYRAWHTKNYWVWIKLTSISNLTDYLDSFR
jgi:hypothetical protein